MHHKDLRDLAEKINKKSVEAADIVRRDGCTPEEEKRAEALVIEVEELRRKYDLLKRAANGQHLLEEMEAEDREAAREGLRDRATAAASKTQAATTAGQGERQVEELDEQVMTKGMEDWQNFARLFGDLLKERENRMPKESRARYDAFRLALRFGPHAIADPALRAAVTQRPEKEAQKELQGFTVQAEERAMSLANSASLGILVPPEAMGPIQLARKAFGGFRASRATRIATSHGRAIPLPTTDDTANEGSYRGEAQAVAAATDPTVDPYELYAYGLTSGVMKVSNELGQDEQFGLEGFLSNLGTIRNERRFQRALTTGTGTSQPTGIITNVPTGVTAAASTSLEPADFYGLKDAVDSAYWTNAEWMISPKALLEAKKMESGVGTPLWQPSFSVGEPPTIDGDPYVVNTHMATVATGNVPIVFGDLSWFYYREVEPPIFLILRELYAGNLQTGYILFSRNDGRLITAGSPVKKLTMA